VQPAPAPAANGTSGNGTSGNREEEASSSDVHGSHDDAVRSALDEEMAPESNAPSGSRLGATGSGSAGTAPQVGSGAVVATSAASSDVLMPMHKKKRARLFEKAKSGRPMSEVLNSAAVGGANIKAAPRLSDFRDKAATSAERQALHAAAMHEWMKSNVTARAIEYATRVRDATHASYYVCAHTETWTDLE
jgi:hypothetical protein